MLDAIETAREPDPRQRSIEELAMIICHCKAVTDQGIRNAVRNGARTRNEVVSACAANMSCGGCAPAIDEIIESECAGEATRGFARFGELAVVS